jgi:hypothetical protein
MNWFKRFGWIYIPTHPMGALVTMMAIVFLIPVFMAIIRNGHSVSDDLYQLFVYTSCTAFWWKWIADKTSIKQYETKLPG